MKPKIDASDLKRAMREFRKSWNILRSAGTEIDIYCTKTSTTRGLKKVTRQGKIRERYNRAKLRDMGRVRTSAENVEIFERQRALGRDPLFVAPREFKTMESKILAMIKRILRRPINKRPLVKALDIIGKLFVSWTRSHVTRRKSEHGPMRPTSRKTNAIKRRMFGKRLPPLRRTGMLLRSLKHRESK